MLYNVETHRCQRLLKLVSAALRTLCSSPEYLLWQYTPALKMTRTTIIDTHPSGVLKLPTRPSHIDIAGWLSKRNVHAFVKQKCKNKCSCSSGAIFSDDRRSRRSVRKSRWATFSNRGQRLNTTIKCQQEQQFTIVLQIQKYSLKPVLLRRHIINQMPFFLSSNCTQCIHISRSLSLTTTNKERASLANKKKKG